MPKPYQTERRVMDVFVRLSYILLVKNAPQNVELFAKLLLCSEFVEYDEFLARYFLQPYKTKLSIMKSSNRVFYNGRPFEFKMTTTEDGKHHFSLYKNG